MRFGAASFWVSKQREQPAHVWGCFGAASFWVSKQLFGAWKRNEIGFGAASFWVSKQPVRGRLLR